MRKSDKVMPALVLVASMLGCQSAPEAATPVTVIQPAEPEATSASPASPASPIAPTEVPEQSDLSWIFDLPAEPVQLDVALETASTVTATIPVEGGTLRVTGADGTVYTLEIPADARIGVEEMYDQR